MLNLIPLARSRWKMTHMNRETGLLRKLLQAILPQTTATAIAPSTIRRNKNLGTGIDNCIILLNCYVFYYAN